MGWLDCARDTSAVRMAIFLPVDPEELACWLPPGISMAELCDKLEGKSCRLRRTLCSLEIVPLLRGTHLITPLKRVN